MCSLAARSDVTCKRTELPLAWRSSHPRRRPPRFRSGRNRSVRASVAPALSLSRGIAQEFTTLRGADAPDEKGAFAWSRRAAPSLLRFVLRGSDRPCGFARRPGVRIAHIGDVDVPEADRIAPDFRKRAEENGADLRCSSPARPMQQPIRGRWYFRFDGSCLRVVRRSKRLRRAHSIALLLRTETALSRERRGGHSRRGGDVVVGALWNPPYDRNPRITRRNVGLVRHRVLTRAASTRLTDAQRAPARPAVRWDQRVVPDLADQRPIPVHRAGIVETTQATLNESPA